MQKPVEKPIKFKKNAATLGKTYPVTHIEAVIDGNGKTLPDILELMLSTIPSTSGDIMSYTDGEGNTRYIASTDDPSGIVGGGGMTELTWLELKTLRDNSQLAAGSLYRITDYKCTTNQENTRSAGHQFDIVLLALSENKLAEEGWAMMHDNIYDVTFVDGVTLKCYLYYEESEEYYTLVRTDTLLGVNSVLEEEIIINEDLKTIDASNPESGYYSTSLSVMYLPYNYFQNSNLSAWKVWYCLDNNKSRFAWADDSVDKDIVSSITVKGRYNGLTVDNLILERSPDLDCDESEGYSQKYYAFSGVIPNTGMLCTVWTKTESVTIDTIQYTVGKGGNRPYEYTLNPQLIIQNITLSHKGTGLPNGRGVIYRLIDEWNNDVPYDFKNIVIFLGGKIEEGYLFSHTDEGNLGDISLTGIFNDITVKKTIDDNNYCQVIDMGILVAESAGRCNIIVAGGALSKDGVNSLPSNFIFGYTME